MKSSNQQKDPKMQVLNKDYVKTLVTLLTQLAVCAIYSHSLVLVRSTHTA